MQEFEKRSAEYRADLRRHRLRAGQPLHDYFVNEVFHDSEVPQVEHDLTNGTVTMRLRNIYSVNQVVATIDMRRAERNVIDDNDFLTTVRFAGVSESLLRLPDRAGPMYYHHCDIDRLQPRWRIRIDLWSGRGSGRITLVFSSVEVEDITPKLRKYMKRGLVTASGLFPTTAR